MPTAGNMGKPTRQRVLWLDHAKAIGIFLVVWGHAIGGTSELANAGNMIYQYIYAFHMPLFYILSGAALWYKWQKTTHLNFGKEIRHCAEHLLVPYAFWIIFYTLLNGFKAFRHAENIWDRMLINIMEGITGYTAPLWFLYTLFFAETLLLLLWQWMKTRQFDSSVSMWGGVMDGHFAGCPDSFPII